MVIATTLVFAVAGAKSLVVLPAKSDACRVTVVATLAEGTPAREFDTKSARKRLTFALLDKTGQPGAPMFGRYARRGNQLRFTPRFRLVSGRRYRATFHPVNGKRRSVDYQVPVSKPAQAAVVTAVYPSASVLPANNLKFHIHFSQPMREGKAIFERIRLLDDTGKAVSDPWRRVEIWSNDYKAFTLYVHPGRIKTGVNLRTEIGPVLVPGRKYRLVIPQTVVNGSGAPLAKSFEKKFRAAAPDHARPLPSKWKLIVPASTTRQPLRITFGESLDQLLLQTMLEVRDSKGKVIAGKLAIDGNERSWSFTPRKPWRAGEYRLHSDPNLEDLAGNTPLRLFDRDLEQPRSSQPRLVRPFHTKRK